MKKFLIFCTYLVLCIPAIGEQITYQTPVNWDEEAWAPAFFAASKIHRNYNKSTFTKFMDEYDKLIKNKKTRELCLADLVEAYRNVFPKLKYTELEQEINRFKEVLISKQNEVTGSDLYMENLTGLQAKSDTPIPPLKSVDTPIPPLQAAAEPIPPLKAVDTPIPHLKPIEEEKLLRPVQPLQDYEYKKEEKRAKFDAHVLNVKTKMKSEEVSAEIEKEQRRNIIMSN